MTSMDAETSDSKWNGLYKVGAASALICALMYLITLAIYIPANRAGPPPGNVIEWFALFQSNPITGLFFLGLADIIIMILWGPMSLALYFALRQTNRTWTILATAFVFVGIAVYLATNTAFSMLYLSHQFTSATTELEKTLALAAGQSMIALSEGTGGRYAGMSLAWLSGLILSIIMLRSTDFNKATAWVGIIGLGLLLVSMPFAGYTTTGPTSVTVNAIIAVTYIGGGLLSLAWYILVGLSLFKLGRNKG